MHHNVWAWRREVEEFFPTPTTEDSMAFALTELAEAFEANLRQVPDYRRNNEKEHTEWRELTQCAMMLLTALGERWKLLHALPELETDISLWKIAMSIGAGGHLYIQHDNEKSMDLWAVQALRVIDRRMRGRWGMDLVETLDQEMKRLAEKHGQSVAIV